MEKISFEIEWKAISPYIFLEISYEELEKYYGKYHREMDEKDNEPGSCLYWAFRYECGLEIIITYHLHKNYINVIADKPEIDHILSHLICPVKNLWRVDQSSDSRANFKDLVTQYFGSTMDLNSKWYLWRQDDNGIKVLIKIFDFQREADCAKSSFERNMHKQTYWVEKVSF